MSEGLNSKQSVSSIVVVDDHEVVRDALKTLIESSGRYQVKGHASSVEEGLSVIEKIKPEFVLLDLNLVDESGLGILAELNKKQIKTNVVVLSMYDDEQRVCQALVAGAKGYIIKSSTSSEFFSALDKIAAGEVYLPAQFQHIRSKFVAAVDSKSVDDFLEDCDPLGKLSEREKQVFSMIAVGEPNRVIAKKLFVSPRTVETHRARLLKKLSLRTTADLIRYAIKHNIMSA